MESAVPTDDMASPSTGQALGVVLYALQDREAASLLEMRKPTLCIVAIRTLTREHHFDHFTQGSFCLLPATILRHPWSKSQFPNKVRLSDTKPGNKKNGPPSLPRKVVQNDTEHRSEWQTKEQHAQGNINDVKTRPRDHSRGPVARLSWFVLHRVRMRPTA